MAGSRLDRIGTIFSRTSGLLKAGAVKYQDRPLWYDIYRVFPPKYEPHIDRKAEKTEITEILYKEDKYRALFFKQFGLNSRGVVRNLNDRNFEEPSQSFATSCLELEKSHPDWDEIRIFEEAAEKYNSTRPLRRATDIVDEDESDVINERDASKRHGRKPPTVTVQSLLSLFKEAKEQQDSKAAADSDETKPPSSTSKQIE